MALRCFLQNSFKLANQRHPCLSLFRPLSTSLPTDLEYVKVSRAGTDGRVGVVTIHRPKALNALCTPLMHDLMTAMQHFQDDDQVGCIVLTGGEKAFAAGADIKEMQPREFSQVRKEALTRRGQHEKRLYRTCARTS